MPWGYTFLRVQNTENCLHLAVYSTVYISEYDCFDVFGTVLALFGTVLTYLALFGTVLTSVLTSDDPPDDPPDMTLRYDLR